MAAAAAAAAGASTEEEGKKLRKAWQDHLRTSSPNAQPVQSGAIPTEVESKVKAMFDELEPYLRWDQAKGSVLNACSGLNHKNNTTEGHMKKICRVPVMIVNWMAGLDPQGNTKSGGTSSDEWEQYLRCIVGHSIILRIVQNKCRAQQLLKIISDNMKEGGSAHTASGGQNVGPICDWVTLDDMDEMEQLIGPQIQQFFDKAKEGRGREGGIDGFNNIIWWFKCEGNEKQQEEQEQKGNPLNSNRIMDLLGDGMSVKLRTVIDPIEKAKECIERNKEDEKLCSRLDCMKQLWNSKGGQTSDAESLWKEVRTQVTNLVTDVYANGVTDADADNLCKDVKCPNVGEQDCVSKETCRIMVKALKEVHKNGKGGQGNYQIFHPTMRCVALNAFAQKLKEHAQGKGYACAVERGIEEAFKVGDEQRGRWCGDRSKGDGSCQPCGKQHQVCTGSMNIGNTSLVKEVRKELDTTNKDNIQKTLSSIKEKVTLCDRMNCIIKQWIDNNTAAATTPGAAAPGVSTTTTEQFWGKDGDVKKLWDELAQKMKATNGTGNGDCDKVQFATDADKAACNYLHAGFTKLKDISESINSKSTEYRTLSKDPSFVQTMGCFLLHSYAKYMQKNATCLIDAGIKEAFKAWEPKKNSTCNGSTEPCVPCQWKEKDHESCTIKTNGSTDPNYKVEDKLEKIVKDDNGSNISTMLSNINKRDNLCEHMKCIATHLNSSTGQGQTNNAQNFWTKDGEVEQLWNQLSGAMTQTSGATISGQCDQMDGGSRPATEPEKKACQYLTLGFNKLKTISVPSAKNGKNILDKDASLKKAMGCFLLKEYAKKMQGKSKCVIDSGLKKAFGTAGKDLNGQCTNGSSCIECKWENSDYDQCQINTTDITDGKTTPTKVTDKLKTVKSKMENEVSTTMNDINTTESLCAKLKCAAPKWFQRNKETTQNGTTNKTWIDFWNEKGEVANLWTELSQAMTKDGGNGTKGNGCDKMDSEERDATGPEKKACNYLHAGLKTLYNGSTTAATTTPSTTSSSGTISLKDNPLLRQTVGCLLLHAYAKKMKETSTCVIDSGIAKAFKAWNEDNKSTCKDNGTKPCVPCEWNEDILESCHIHTTDATRTNQTAVKSKLTQVQGNIDRISNINLKDINKMSTLCDYIRCVGPKWFKNKAKTTNGNIIATKDWCNFWEEEGVRTTLQDMFQKIVLDVSNTSGANTNNATCRIFGDNNPDSVERKACNHIAAGLKYIKNIPSNVSGSGSVGAAAAAPAPAAPAPAANQNGHQHDDNFFKQSMMCAALNLYATKIKKASEEKCPIDEKKIEAMFETWNRINNSSCNAVRSASKNNCFLCSRQKEEFNNCKLSVSKTLINTTSTQTNGDCETNATKVKTKMEGLLNDSKTTKMKETLSTITNMDSFCSKMQCAAKQYHKNKHNGAQPKTTLSWDDISTVVNEELQKLLKKITDDKNWKKKEFEQYCTDNIGSSWSEDTGGERTAKQKACKLFALGLKHISDIKNKKNNNQDHEIPLKQTMMCAALNLYADQLINKSNDQCPLDKQKMTEVIDATFLKSDAIMKNGTPSCSAGNGINSCSVCTRQKSTFDSCKIGQDNVKDSMNTLLQNNDKTNTNTSKMEQTLDKINSKDTFCTQVQCAIRQHYNNKDKNKSGQAGGMTTPNWRDINEDAKGVLTTLLEQMTKGQTESDVDKYCKNDEEWSKLGHKEKHTNKAACLLFAAGLKHIYVRGKVPAKGQVNGSVKGPSFEQTMGCLFLKEYAEQLKKMAEIQKKYKVHPDCSVDSGIEHAFGKSKDIMKSVLPECSKGPNSISCFECKFTDNYNDCPIGQDDIGNKAKYLFKGESEQNHMQQTLENTVCPILITDLLTPFLPLAPVSIGLSAMAYYLWKYFGPLDKGGPRFRRSPAEIPGSSVQEQLLDHVEEAGPHEYRLVKERKPRSAPTRTKRSGGVNRRTIIEIHFEVLDECQKGDTQLNQKDFLELLVQEFMGSELMEEEEQVPKEEVPMELVPIEEVPMERVPSLGSGFMV
ncbi:SICAvar type I [Plasmodium knowlesi]|uniref:SICAvar type I n=2 Tax=Plasmodium knowlesi TaxID=5850 RepID=A0A1Y3DHE1_PLAKN|nr:SICAvar type I [Plasmodium knowlesi]